jgi:hypothetical protein
MSSYITNMLRIKTYQFLGGGATGNDPNKSYRKVMFLDTPPYYIKCQETWNTHTLQVILP